MKHLAILILVAGSLASDSQTQQPEQVCLTEILIRAPETATPEQVNEAKHKAEQVRNSAEKSRSFSDLARANSQGVSAAQGGAIGCYKRGVAAIGNGTAFRRGRDLAAWLGVVPRQYFRGFR